MATKRSRAFNRAHPRKKDGTFKRNPAKAANPRRKRRTTKRRRRS